MIFSGSSRRRLIAFASMHGSTGSAAGALHGHCPVTCSERPRPETRSMTSNALLLCSLLEFSAGEKLGIPPRLLKVTKPQFADVSRAQLLLVRGAGNMAFCPAAALQAARSQRTLSMLSAFGPNLFVPSLISERSMSETGTGTAFAAGKKRHAGRSYWRFR